MNNNVTVLCNDASLAGILSMIKAILLMIQIIVPILLIIMASIQLTLLVRNPDDKKQKKKVLNSFLAAFFTFFIPLSVNILMGILGENYNFSSCWNNAKLHMNSNSTYVPVDEKKRHNIISSSNDYEKGNESQNITFDLEHAFKVHDNIHRKENRNLAWHGKLVGNYGGDIGAYTEAINIINNTDYRIYEVYNFLVSKHPEHKTKNVRVSSHEDVNQYYNIKVSFIKRSIPAIKEALLSGKLVHGGTNTNKWTDSTGKHVNWPGTHNGLLFYYDGTYFHMKAAGAIDQADSIYTESQLQEWLGSLNWKLIVYERR